MKKKNGNYIYIYIYIYMYIYIDIYVDFEVRRFHRDYNQG